MRLHGSRWGWRAWFGALILAAAGGYAASFISDHHVLTLAYAVVGLACGAFLLYQNARSRWTRWVAGGAFLVGFVLTRAQL